ncbi:hypothetical protein GRI62_00545 [Erythrobacter arachoides]|uniref:Uncharacterized protein n=1 Tax=Aurantiacibacter arachoides TaxID=1850444 RepID=A0A844ZXA7_9SPHN|nr:hypothetical protein [Aurantiacibacter arachoides]MXO92094.1 hypothetical protein [Aurantiacibacter arachoides]GGD59777.1 hypothetical protein GCM10011411_19960 [Aurantiacibacter arachoides]
MGERDHSLDQESGGRRSGERRQQDVPIDSHDRRENNDRRSGSDRRSTPRQQVRKDGDPD